MSVDYSWAARLVFWAVGFYLLMNTEIHKEYYKIAKILVGFCVAIFILDFGKNILAYNDIIIWKGWFAVKRIAHTIILFWVIIKSRQLEKKYSFINN